MDDQDDPCNLARRNIIKFWNRIEDSQEKPKIVGYMSKQGSEPYNSDLSQLKYYIPPDEKEVHLDLNAGYDQLIKKEKTPLTVNNINDLLRWVEMHPEVIESYQPDFICMRRSILDVMFSYTDIDNDGWIICAAKYKGIIYLCNYELEDNNEEGAAASTLESKEKIESWDFKYKQYMLRDDPAKPSDTSKPVNENEQFYGLFTNKLGKYRFIYAGELDGVQSNEIITEESILDDEIKFVKLKVHSKPYNMKYPSHSFVIKVAKAWCEASLSCIEEILFGLRTEAGTVTELKKYSTNEWANLPKGVFLPQKAKKMCANFFSQIKTTLKDDDNNNKICKCSLNTKIKERIDFDIVSNRLKQSKYSFLPLWFMYNRSNIAVVLYKRNRIRLHSLIIIFGFIIVCLISWL